MIRTCDTDQRPKLVPGVNLPEMPQHRALAFRHSGGYLLAGEGLLHNLSLVDNVALLRLWQHPE